MPLELLRFSKFKLVKTQLRTENSTPKTRHYYPAFADAVFIPAINMVALITVYIHDHFSHVQKAGLLVSPAVNMTSLYAWEFKRFDLQDVWPDLNAQVCFLMSSDGSNKGHRYPGQRSVSDGLCPLEKKGVEFSIVACTGLSALDAELPLASIDAADVLAGEIIAVAKEKNEKSRGYALWINGRSSAGLMLHYHVLLDQFFKFDGPDFKFRNFGQRIKRTGTG
ncbi:hypothetical protein [Desulfobacula sp.]|uniref:hypothetical protein n=1 Tax=Desulfobacula sp. TaxID=2593537 RepID=UPI00261A2E84|nr:hypothetical protein [Desulfobacula sp.]